MFEWGNFIFLSCDIELFWSFSRLILFLFRWLFSSQYFPVKVAKQRHVFGGRIHFPPFKQGGEQIAAKELIGHYIIIKYFQILWHILSIITYQNSHNLNTFSTISSRISKLTITSIWSYTSPSISAASITFSWKIE